MRYRVKRGLDRNMFSRTARVTKDINVRPMVYRGGIRL